MGAGSGNLRRSLTANPWAGPVRLSAEPAPASAGPVDVLVGRSPALAGRRRPPARTPGLDPRLGFESFVVGRSNRLAHAAARSVADAAASRYNPLFLHGESGNGKTHLLHAIGLAVQARTPEVDVRYVTSDRFTNEVISSLAGGDGRSGFTRRYRACSLLLVDDLQFLEGKVETQTELFHTFDEVTANGGRVVLSADRHPGDIPTLPERLRSRFTSGLVADLEPPDFETRVAILARKVADAGARVPASVLELIAGAASRNVRELEGALTRVLADASLDGRPVLAAGAESSLAGFLGTSGRPVTAAGVVDEAAAVFGVTVEELCGYGRTGRVVLARQAAMYVCRTLTEDSLPAIGRAFGGRDHTTVLHAVRKIEQLVVDRRPVQAKVVELMARLGRRGPGPG
ncbi:MAG: chromosomal replication initiator protein DnaA [Actinomycetota bacterium]